ncbi:uncharacterized protein BXZ73DRAFT_46327 [Epithele typhae]|uniref:uncharacterized protein n=1 Tax=Epithele typhae TaxID=378194 RepID=UPI0020082D73|nr:uncharacterized protein BXZ73DRAFT_46327 [Epithele typhae]KAH9933557.1 hypothetical protein BXZ73DRAFT_46327 [Epithele typhae]
MPAKYSHVKKRPPPKKPRSDGAASSTHQHHQDHQHPSPRTDKSISHAMSAVSKLERTIARILLIRFEQDMARLFSTHLYCVALLHLPTFVLRCVTIGGPSWVAANADSDEIKDFFRTTIAMDMRQAGERVATKSVLWTYTALRHFAKSNGIPICQTRGLHSARLLPHYDALKAHLESLETRHSPAFAKPPHLGPLTEGVRTLTEACEKSSRSQDWQYKVREGYDRVCSTLWRVAREFDVRGYGLVLRDKLTSKWCDCGCSTDHLSEVCEKTVRLEEEESGVRSGKEREWDGRGSGVGGWGTEEEEDMWTVEFDFIGTEHELHTKHADGGTHDCCDMTVTELMEWRYLRAEREKEQGNLAFKKGDYEEAIQRYKDAYAVEPEMPHYQLNLAAAYLKVNNFVEAEKACDISLTQHKSVKAHWRRAQARKAQGQTEDALRDLRAVLRLQPSNSEALTEICLLCPSEAARIEQPVASGSSSSAPPPVQGSTWIPAPKVPKPLPFARGVLDDRKLKISTIPITVEIPEDLSIFAADTASPSKTKATATANADALKTSSGRMMKQTFQYPSWERYMVSKAD